MPEQPASIEHRQHLLDEQRVALGGGDDPARARPRRRRRSPSRFSTTALGVRLGERLERDAAARRGRSAQSGRAARAGRGRAGARAAASARLGDRVEDVLDRGRGRSAPPSGCRRRARPAAVRCASISKSFRAPRRSRRSRKPRRESPIAAATRSRDDLVVAASASIFAQRHVGRVVLADRRGLAHDLAQRPERDAVAVGEAAAREHVARSPATAQELLAEARLAHARRRER